MNVRLSVGEVRFRISSDEYASLCRGAALAETIMLPDAVTFAASIRPAASDSPVTLELRGRTAGVCLLVSQEGLRMLSAEETLRDGLEACCPVEGASPLRVCLQVDAGRSRKKSQ